MFELIRDNYDDTGAVGMAWMVEDQPKEAWG